MFSVRLQTNIVVKKLRGFEPLSFPSEFTWGCFNVNLREKFRRKEFLAQAFKEYVLSKISAFCSLGFFFKLLQFGSFCECVVRFNCTINCLRCRTLVSLSAEIVQSVRQRVRRRKRLLPLRRELACNTGSGSGV